MCQLKELSFGVACQSFLNVFLFLSSRFRYIPAIFGVVLLAGVGILTSSLGDVMDEEASLGLQSGARAKKEIERSRSSYFKRR